MTSKVPYNNEKVPYNNEKKLFIKNKKLKRFLSLLYKVNFLKSFN